MCNELILAMRKQVGLDEEFIGIKRIVGPGVQRFETLKDSSNLIKRRNSICIKKL